MSFYEKLMGGQGRAQIQREMGSSEGGENIGGGARRQEQAKQTEIQLCAGFNQTLEVLKQKPDDLQARIERLKASPDCGGVLGKAAEYFTDEHWEMAATLEEYDKTTFNHSLRVLQFVHGLATSGSQTATYLKKMMRTEGAEGEQISLPDLLTAALFHDIGKTAIPCNILHDHTTRHEWAKRANAWATQKGMPLYYEEEKLDTLVDDELDGYLMDVKRKQGHDPLDIIPVKQIFSAEDLAVLEAHGISTDLTFRKILEIHETATKAVLRTRGMYKASDIASLHHDYHKTPIRETRYKTSTSVIRIGVVLSMLRSMDIYDALTSDDRSYKKAYHPLIAMKILIKEARVEFIETNVTRMIVGDLYSQYKKNHTTETERDSAEPLDQLSERKRQIALNSAEEEIVEFLAEEPTQEVAALRMAA